MSTAYSITEDTKTNLHIRRLHSSHGDSEPLQLSTGELADLTVENNIQLQIVAQLLLVLELELGVEHLVDSHVALDGARDVVHVLRLDQRLEVVFEHLCEVVLQLGAAEVLEDLLPIWRVLLQSVRRRKAKPEIECTS